MKFAESVHCQGRAHCTACRDPGPRGQAFRASLAKSFEMPGCWPDCPHGVTHADLPAPARSEEAEAACQAISDVCRACPQFAHVMGDRASVKCRAAGSACGCVRFLTGCCPLGKWCGGKIERSPS